MSLQYHAAINEHRELGAIEVVRVDSKDNPADGFTKALGPNKFPRFASFVVVDF